MYLSCDSAAASELADHGRGLFARSCNEVFRKSREFYLVLVHECGKRLRVESLHFGKRVICFRSAGMRDHRLELGGERAPVLGRNDTLAGTVRLVPEIAIALSLPALT